MRVEKSRQAASAQRTRLRAARRSQRRLEREQLDVIESVYWHRCWQWRPRPKVKPGTRVRVPRGVLHVSRIGLAGQQYLCGRPARGRVVASAAGVDLPRALLCRRCLRMVLEEAECGG